MEVSDSEMSPNLQQFQTGRDKKVKQFTFINNDSPGRNYDNQASYRKRAYETKNSNYKSIEKSQRVSNLTIEIEEGDENNEKVYEPLQNFKINNDEPGQDYAITTKNMRYQVSDEEPILSKKISPW